MKQKGFTLIELLVVVAIIGVLASIILASLNNARSQARDARRESDVQTMKKMLELYHIDNGNYPTTNWVHSNAASWATLQTALAPYGTLPVDPVNDTGFAYDGVSLSYGYSAANTADSCWGQAYRIAFNKENSNGTGADDGVRLCDGVLYNYSNAFVVGVSPRQ